MAKAGGGVNGSAPGPGPGGIVPEAHGPHGAHRLESVVEGVEGIAASLGEAMALAPSAGTPSAGGEQPHADGESLRSGIRRAGPVAVAGVVANGANVLVTVAVSHLLHARQYGALTQLLGLFVILAMPGSAVLVGVVRRITSWETAGRGDLARRWTARLHAWGTVAVLAVAAVMWLLQGWVARELSLPGPAGVVSVLVAGAVWILLSVDRGVLQAHRSYRLLAGNLVLEAAVRTVCAVAFASLGLGVGGVCAGLLLCEVAAAVHARWTVLEHPRRLPWGAPLRDVLGWRDLRPALRAPEGMAGVPAVAPAGAAALPVGTVAHGRREMIADVGVAMASLALLGVLQNADVILVGRDLPGSSGAYAAVSVASKALVFGALALAGYLLPEATIRWHEGHHALRQMGITLAFLAVPAVALLGISVLAPGPFLRLVFSARLDAAAPAFAPLVGAMVCLGVTVVLTVYLLGVGCRWIVSFLAGGAVLVVLGTALAHGAPLRTARNDFFVQLLLTVTSATAFALLHRRTGRGRLRAGEGSRV